MVGELREVALTEGLYPSEASLIAGAVRVGVDALLDGLVGGRGAVKEVVEVLPVALLILDAEACREGEGTSSGIQSAAPIEAKRPLQGVLQGVLREVAGVDPCGGSILEGLRGRGEGPLIASIAELGGEDQFGEAVGLPLHTDVGTVGVFVTSLGALTALGSRARGEVILLPAVGDLVGGIAPTEDVGVELELRRVGVIEVAAKHSGGQDTIGITAWHTTATASIATASCAHPHHESELVAVLADVGEACVVGVVEATEEGELVLIGEAAEG